MTTSLPSPLARACCVALLLIAYGVPAASGQHAEPQPPNGAPVDVSGLAAGRYATMEMLYERTIFQVDVLRLTLRFGPETAATLEGLVAGRDYEEELVGRVVDAALEARDVLVRTHFLRDVSLEQYLDGIRENLEHAREAGLLSDEEQRDILEGLAAPYEPLRERGIRDGDTAWYRIRGDRLHIVVETREGDRPVDLALEGAHHRRAVVGGYLSPGSDFREPLVRSLFRPAD